MTDKTARCNNKEEEGRKQHWKDEALNISSSERAQCARGAGAAPGGNCSVAEQVLPVQWWTDLVESLKNTFILAPVICLIYKYSFWDAVFTSVVEWLSSALPSPWISRLSGALVTWIETPLRSPWLAAAVVVPASSPGSLGLILLLLKLSEARQAACSGSPQHLLPFLACKGPLQSYPSNQFKYKHKWEFKIIHFYFFSVLFDWKKLLNFFEVWKHLHL